jgi:hypothetical protein
MFYFSASLLYKFKSDRGKKFIHKFSSTAKKNVEWESKIQIDLSAARIIICFLPAPHGILSQASIDDIFLTHES